MYQVILADPPWYYPPRKKGSKFGGGAGGQYPLMTTKDLVLMRTDVEGMADTNALLAMWVTCPRLPDALIVMEAWGFRFSTVGFTWIKVNKDGSPFAGPGNYTASNTELVLFGVRGSMRPEKRLVQQVIVAPRREHSRKPVEVYERLEAMYPNAKRLELFARTRRPGWDAWGNEPDKFSCEDLGLVV